MSMRNLFSGRRDAFEFPFRFILGQVKPSVICREAILRIFNFMSRDSKSLPKIEKCPNSGSNGQTQAGFCGDKGTGERCPGEEDAQRGILGREEVSSHSPDCGPREGKTIVLSTAWQHPPQNSHPIQEREAGFAPEFQGREDGIPRLQDGEARAPAEAPQRAWGPPKTPREGVSSSLLGSSCGPRTPEPTRPSSRSRAGARL